MTKTIDLSKFTKRSDLTSGITVVAHLALVLAPVYLASLLGPSLYWIALWIWFGVLMNGLINLMHESAHYHVFKSRGGSDFLGRWVLGPLAVTDFDAYRWRHWKHHTNLGVDGDTKDAYLVDIGGIKLILFFLRCLILAEAFRKFRHQVVADEVRNQKPSSPLVWLTRTVLVQGLFLASLFAVAALAAGRSWPRAFISAALAYGLVYAYGLMSLTVFMATLRAIAEHQLETGQVSSTGRAALRNFSSGPVSRLIFGAYGFAEHATHHCEPGLPYYHLPGVTRDLAGADPELMPNHHYLQELITLVRPAVRTSNVNSAQSTSARSTP
jgi:fatty acid desaturase